MENFITIVQDLQGLHDKYFTLYLFICALIGSYIGTYIVNLKSKQKINFAMHCENFVFAYVTCIVVKALF